MITKNCEASKAQSGKWLKGHCSGVFWEVDFPEVRPGKYLHKYFRDNFSAWVETYPIKRGMAQVVMKKILEDILP